LVLIFVNLIWFQSSSYEADNELVRGQHTQPKSFDRGLSNDHWELDDLVSLEDSENDGEGHETAICGLKESVHGQLFVHI